MSSTAPPSTKLRTPGEGDTKIGAKPHLPEPMEQLSQIRESFGKSLQPSEGIDQRHNYDIEQNIREIRAILSTNA